MNSEELKDRTKRFVEALLQEAQELTRIFGASRRTAQARSLRKARA